MTGCLRVVAALTAAVALSGCGWQGTDLADGLTRPGMRDLEAPDRALQKAVRATRAQTSGAISVYPTGITGSFDREAGVQRADFDTYEVVDGEQRDYVLHRVVVGDEVYFQADYPRGDECWLDQSGSKTYGAVATDGAEQLRLVDALTAVSGKDYTFEATAPSDVLRDAMFGYNASDDSGVDEAAPPDPVRVPVTVWTSDDAVQLVIVDTEDVIGALDVAGVSVEQAFGQGVDEDYFDGLDEVRVTFSNYGFPVEVERPDPADILVSEGDSC